MGSPKLNGGLPTLLVQVEKLNNNQLDTDTKKYEAHT